MKTWFITGCSTGFGRELATAVLAQGDRVVVTARKPEQIEDIVAKYDPSKALVLKLDVTSKTQITDAVNKAIEVFGTIDVLVNNAGIGYLGSIEESDEEEVRKMFEINFWGLAHMTNAVLPYMRKEKSGTIINFSSLSGLRAFPAVGYYAASKFAVEGFSEALGQEVEPFGIRVLTVEPSAFRTDWAGRSAAEAVPSITDYDPTNVRVYVKGMRSGSGNQAGDPQKAAAAIIANVAGGASNTHLPLGARAFEMTMQKLDAMKTEFASLESIARDADSPKP